MDLKDFNAPLPKPWLNINANSLKAPTGEVDQLTTQILVMEELKSVPNPPVNNTSLFSTGLGNLTQVDTSGNTVTYAESGPVNSLATTLTDVAAQAEGIAPPGQRDLLHSSSSNSNNVFGLVYSPYLDIVLNPDNTGGLVYSLNGGASFSAASFDVAPTDYLTIGVGPNTPKVVAFSNSGQYYTSNDGQNFTLQGTSATIKPQSFFIIYAPGPGLFITSDYNTPGNGIATSPDGITWTSRPFVPLVDVFAVNSNMIVGVLGSFPYIVYSFDGINWHNSPTSSFSEGIRSVAYSQDKNQWMLLTVVTGGKYTSPDGITWTHVSTDGFSCTAGLMWVPEYGRWYAAAKDPDGNVSLWSSPDSSIPFISTHLDGTFIPGSNLQDAPAWYSPSRGSFIMGLYTANPICVYTTPRPYDIKALSDNIRVRGFPVAIGIWSGYPSTTVTDTTTETSLSSPLNTLGTLVLDAAQAVGAQLEWNFQGLLTSAGGDTLTLRIKINSTTVLTHTVTVPSSSTNLPINLRTYFTVQAATMQINSHLLVSGVSTVIVNATPSYAPKGTNTFSLTGQWAANASTIVMNQMKMNGTFLNGA